MSKFNTIVTGTGRCGTGYFAALLNSMGLICGHESVFNLSGLGSAKKRIAGEKPFTVSCTCGHEQCKESCMSNVLKEIKGAELQADSSYLAAPFLDDDDFKNYNFIHVLRNPIDVIKSFVQVANYFNENDIPKHSIFFQEFIKLHLSEVYENSFSQADRGYLYYVGWNKMIQNKLKNRNKIVYRVEENNENRILNFLKKENCDFDLKIKKINHWKNDNGEHLRFKVFGKEVADLLDQYEKGEFCS